MNNPTLHATAMRRASVLAAGMAVIATLFSLGCQSARPYPNDAMIPSRPVTLSPGDVVKVAFSGAPELSQMQTIKADGKVSLPQIGEMHAAGKLLPQLQREIEELYEPLLTNSDVLVTLENGVMSVYMSGAVTRPGKISFNRPTTILQVIAEAGGVTMFGSLKKVRVFRLEKGQNRVQTLDLRSAMKGKIRPPVTGPFYIRDGDIISIPQSAF
jgi:polysaccharide export outer membrane protein